MGKNTKSSESAKVELRNIKELDGVSPGKICKS
jgi:hypothetical protein